MKKLYIVTYYLLSNPLKHQPVKCIWATCEEEAECLFLEEKENNPDIIILETQKVHDAINKQDLSDRLDRYINKPVLNKTLLTYSCED